MDETFPDKIEEIIQRKMKIKKTMQQKVMLRVIMEVTFMTKFAELQYQDFHLFYKD